MPFLTCAIPIPRLGVFTDSEACASVPLNECTNPHRRIGSSVQKHLCASTSAGKAQVHSGVRP